MGRTRHFENGLTPRQREVLRLIAKGHTNGEIADKLGVSLAGAKWHVSELLSRFGVNSREDLAELMERERRGPVERTRGWMAGLAGLVTVKVGAGTAVAAGVGLATAGGIAGVAMMLSDDRGEQGQVHQDVSELLPEDPEDSLFTSEEAYAVAATEAERLFTDLESSERTGHNFELVEARWLPSSTSFWFRGFGWKWESANREVHDLWAFRWEMVGGELLGEDANVTVLVSDGSDVPAGSLGTFKDFVTGAELVLKSGVGSYRDDAMLGALAQPAMHEVLRQHVAVLAALDASPWCQGQGGISPVGPARVTASCPMVLPEHELIRPYLDTRGTPDGASVRTMHVAYRQPIVRIAVVLDTGGEVEILHPDRSPHPPTLTGSVIVPHGSYPTEVIGYDADGNEVGRREYPPRPVRP